MPDQIRAPVDPNEDLSGYLGITPNPNEDLYGYLRITPNPDGSITRLGMLGTPASTDPSNPFHLTKDLTINKSKGTWARIFVPRETFDSSTITKLPLVVYFHGGGFIICSANGTVFDSFYAAIVTGIPAVVVSVEYRLAPEHRLPAAYDDCIECLHWMKTCEDEWLVKYADFSKCFLMGTSAGGNIAYHVGLRASACVDDLKPLEIKGLILHHAFFGGAKRSGSELRLAHDKVVPLCASDLMWELSLPVDVDRDHEYCNPMTSGVKPEQFDLIKVLKWKILVVGCDGDPTIDRQIELVKKLEENGVSVIGKFDEGGFHGWDLVDPSKAKAMFMNLKEFVHSATLS